MVRIDLDAETPASYFYVRGEHFFDFWTADPTIAEAALAALPPPGASAAPVPSATPVASPAASASAAP